MPKYFSYLKVWPTRCLALGQTELMTLAVCVHVYAHVCVCVKLCLSCLHWLSQWMDHYTLCRDLVSAPHLALLYPPKLFFL